MNKIFKVVWSKTKECYVVVSEFAKNNGGKKKVLASVLAGLAMVGMGATVQAADMNADTSANTKNQINIWANTTNKVNPATPGATTTSGSGTANANDVDPSQYGDEIGIAIGSQNKIKPGITTNAGGGSSIAMGIQNEVRGNRNVAIGTSSKTYGENSIALGTKVEAGTGHGIAIGSDDNGIATVAYGGIRPNATGSNVGNAFALAIGSGAQADGRDNNTSGGIAIGQLVKATHNNTIAIGVNTTASDSNSVAIGSSAQATQKLSTAYGPNTNANSKGGVAIGTNAAVGTDTGLTTAITGATAVGAYAEAQSENASAFGRNAKADKNAEKATALGAYAMANIAGGVALGSESKTTKDAGEIGYNPATGRTNDYNKLTNNTKAALTSTRAAVSIGDDSASVTRQLTGLAAGTQDTDAVNVAQLKAVNLKFAGDSTQVTGSTDVRLNDGTFNVNGDGTLISTEATATGIKVTAKEGGKITNTDGKAVAPTTNGIATTDNVTQAINNSGWKANASANGGTLTGSPTATKVVPGDTVTFSAGKNLTVEQTLGTNTQQYTYGLSSTLKDIESIQNGTSKITLNNGGGTTISGGNLSVDGNKITNVATGTAGTDAVNVKQLNDTEKHIKPGTYAVANDGSVTLKYVDGNGAEQTETAKITGIAKKSKVINGQNTTVEEGTDTADNSVIYKVNVKGDLADISSITNGSGSGKISFEGDQVVKVGGDHPISFDGKGGYVTGLENKTWNLKNPTVVSGRAATEDQLKAVSDGFNNTVKLTGNTGATGTQKLNQDNGLSFGVVGADNGKYITTTASGSNVVADLSTDAKNKLNSKVVVAGSGAATVATPTVTTNADGSTVTTYTVHVDPVAATAASTESVVKKAAATGDKNIADVSVAGGKAVNDPGAQYEVSVSKNAVKDAAREAVTVNNGGNTDSPITVTPTEDAAKHNTSYAVTFDGAKAAKVIPLTYKANGTNKQTVTLEKGLNFTNGSNTTASVDAEGVVKYDLNKDVDLSNTGSLTVGGTTVNNDGITIKAPTPAAGATPTTDVKLTNTGLDNGGNKITNVKAGENDTDAVNVKQLKANRTEVKAGDNVVVTSDVDATDNHTVYTVNAVTPAVYTTPNGEKLTKDKDGKFHKVGETAEYTGDIITSFENPKAAAGQTTKDGGMIVNNIGSAIKNQTGADYLTKLDTANGATPNAAVNVSDLKNTADALKSNELHIRPTASNRTGETVNKNAAGTADEVYKYDTATKSVTLKYNDGTGVGVTGTEAKIDLSDLANQITSGYTFKANATANGGTVANDTATPATATAVENGGTINYAAGKNLTVKQEIDATNKTHTYTYSLDKDLTNLDKVVVNGKDGVAGKDGVTIVGPQGATGATGIPGTNGIDGKVGITGKDGKDAVSIAGKDGVGTIGLTGPQGPAGTNGKSVDISTENGTKTLVKPEANNNDQSQRIVYVPKDANGNPLKDADNNDIKREVATMDDGLKFTGNNESTENKQKLGSLVKVQGEGTKEGADATGAKEIQTSDGTKFESAKDNIAVEADGANTLTVKLNKDLKGLDSVTTKEVKLGDANDNISIKKAGDRITYTTPGSTDTHKVATLDDEMHIKDKTYTVDNKKVTLTYVDGNGADVAGKKAIIDLSGLPVGDKDTDMRIKEGTYTAQNGKVTLNTVDKGGNPVTGKDVVIDGINTNNYVAGDNVTLTPDTDAAGKPVVKINAALSTEKVVKKAGADNLATVSTASGNVAGDKGETYEVAVTKGDIENNAEISYKANGGTAQKTTLANGFNFTSDDNSVAITTGANGKVNFKVDTTNIQGKAFNLDVNKEGTGKVETAQTAAATPSVEKGTKFVAGNNLSIRHDGINGDANYDHQVTYALNSDLQGITSITNNGGATMNFGPNEISMTGGNLNMGGSKITNVKNGTDKSDVATVGQLTKVTSNDNTVAINKTTDADGAPVYDLSVQGGGHDPRVDQLGEEIGRVGAQGAALAALKPIQYDPLEPTQIMAGYGNYRGNSAIAMGVAHYKNESTLMHAGVSWAGGSRHMIANAGVTWKVGNRDSEAAVADRYRKGPISSAYAMQQEMASVKAQNAGLKTEVSDLKAENEQMKAQIAAMMAKLGM